jgi:hypothetical protein
VFGLQLADGMVCWTVSDKPRPAVLNNSATAGINNAMQVQRSNAKKCKFQEDRRRQQPDLQPPLLPADPCPLLRPFCHQVSLSHRARICDSSTNGKFRPKVGGHTQFLQLDQSTVCKPLIPRELSFYLNAPPDIRTFTPKCKGTNFTKAR